MRRVGIVLMFAVLIMFASNISATIINVPGDQPNIQAGINVSSYGDTVRVASGTYVEIINFSGKNIVIGSWFLDAGDPSYILSTIIDGGASGSVVTFENGEDNTAVITGFTIQNGLAWYSGGGIYCYLSSPTINSNTISGNAAAVIGGGIYGWHSSPTINSNTISENSAQYGGGILCYVSNPTITNNTISGNSASIRGGGIYCYSSSPVITNTIFWGDSAPTGPEIYSDGASSPVITYCDVQGGWEGDGNIDCDPMFCDPDNGNYYIADTSCCIGEGESGVDIGAFGRGCGVNITINVPADYSTIQEAIHASIDRDTVRVAPDTYFESINFNGKNIVVGSWFLDHGNPSYISSTIIDGNAADRVVRFQSGETNDAKIIGFTIQNGLATVGGGICCWYNCNPTISYNTISGNTADFEGGGIYCHDSNPTISYNTISGNTAGAYGSGINCHHSSPTINCNTISGNTAGDYGGGICCWYNSNPTISNSIFWGNSAQSAPEIFFWETSPPVITYCDVEGGWAGEGNIDCDPMFCNPENGNYYLDAASCCVGAGEGGIDIGALGIGCQMRYEYLPGDCNMALGLWPPAVIGGDVSYLVGYFIGSGNASCDFYDFWASADITGDCTVIGGDVSALVGFFTGTVDEILWCPDYEPAWLEGVPDDPPDGWPNCDAPVINSRVIPTGSGK